jgi:hypothetical protein
MRTAEIVSVLRQRDPHRHREISRTATQLVERQRRPRPRATAFHAARAASSHHVHAFERFERAQQHGRRRSFGFGHRVDQGMNAVIEVDVREPGRAVQRRIARRRSRSRMTRGIRLADVRLDFDDDPARADAAPVVHEDFPNQIARDVERRPVVERAR